MKYVSLSSLPFWRSLSGFVLFFAFPDKAEWGHETVMLTYLTVWQVC